jgi:hypothetical protein
MLCFGSADRVRAAELVVFLKSTQGFQIGLKSSMALGMIPVQSNYCIVHRALNVYGHPNNVSHDLS